MGSRVPACFGAVALASAVAACGPPAPERVVSLEELRDHARFHLDARAERLTLTFTPDETLAHVPGEDTKPCLLLDAALVVRLGDRILSTDRAGGIDARVQLRSLEPPAGDTSDRGWDPRQPYRHGPNDSSNGSKPSLGRGSPVWSGTSGTSRVCAPLVLSFVQPLGRVPPRERLTLEEGGVRLALPLGDALAKVEWSRIGSGDVAPADEIVVELGTHLDVVHDLQGKVASAGAEGVLSRQPQRRDGSRVSFVLPDVPAGEARLTLEVIDLERDVSSTCAAPKGCAIRALVGAEGSLPLRVVPRR